MIKVLITTFTFHPQRNGVANVVWAHATGLADRGYDVTVATNKDEDRHKLTLPQNLQIAEFDITGSPLIGYSGSMSAFQEFVANFRGDVIMCHAWQNWCTDLAITVFERNQARKILISHGVTVNSVYLQSLFSHYSHSLGRSIKTLTSTGIRFGKVLIRSLQNWWAFRPYVRNMQNMMQKFDHLVFLTGMQDMDRFYDKSLAGKLRLDNWSVIPNGAWPEKFADKLSDFRSLYGISNKRLVLNVSNYIANKNQEMALRAFLRANPCNAVLVFIGSEINDYTRRLQRIYEQHKSSSSIRVLFLEKVPQNTLNAAYKAADLFLFSSLSEVQPLVILEAMASATPFISTDVGCVRELPGGITVHSESQMAKQIRQLLDNPQLCNELAIAGSNACLKKYNWNHIIDQYDRLLQSWSLSTVESVREATW